MITIKYTISNNEYSIDYTIDQIRNELVWYGIPKVNQMSEAELIKSIKEINNN